MIVPQQSHGLSNDLSITRAGRKTAGRRSRAILGVAAATAAVGLALTARAATNNPIAATGYNTDLILETSAPTSAQIGFDIPNGYNFYVSGLVSGTTNSSSYGVGVPTSGLFTSAATGSSTAFQLQNYTGPNAVFLNNNVINQPYVESAGTLKLSTPAAYSSLAICTSTTNGAQVIGYTLNYTDGTSAGGTFTSLDWYTGGTTTALKGIGRASRSSNPVVIDTSTGLANPNMYEVDLPASAFTATPGKLLSSITFTDTNTSTSSQTATAIWAISGSLNTPLVYTGATNSNFDTGTANFANAAGAPTAFANGSSSVTFDDTAAAGSNNVVVQTGGVSPVGVTFNNSLVAYTVSGGPIAGAFGLTLNGTNSVTLSNANTFTGPTTVNAGTLVIGSGGSIASTAVTVATGGTFTILAAGQTPTTAITLVDNGTVNLNNPSRTLASLTGTGTVNLNGTVLSVAGTGGTFSGTIAGTGSVAYNSGTSIVTGVNTYSGGTTFGTGAVVTINGQAALSGGPLVFSGGGLSATTPLTAAAGAAITYPYSFGTTPTATFTGTTAIELAGAGTLPAAGGTFSVTGTGPVTLSGPLAGGGLVKSGSGQLILTNTANAQTSVNASGGILTFSTGTLGTGAVNLSGGTVQYAGTNTTDLTAGGRTLNLNTSGGVIDTNGNNVTFTGSVNGTNLGQFVKAGNGSLTLNGTVRPTTVYVVGTGSTLALVGTAALATPTSTSYVGYNASDSGTLTVDGGKYLSIGTVYVGYTGASTVGATPTTGVLNLLDTAATNNTAYNASIMYVGYGGSAAANLSTGTVNQTAGATTVTSTSSSYIGYYGTGTYNLNGGTATFNATTLYDGYFSPSVGTINLNAGTFTAAALKLANSAGSTGILNLNPGGNLVVASLSGGSGTSTVNFNGGTVTANASSTTFISALTNAKVLAGGIVLNTNGFNVSIPTTITTGVTGSADGGLTKTGAGILTLSGVSSYTGPTNIASGSLTFAPAAGVTQTLAGVISGAGSITEAGPGLTILTGNNTFSGGTVVTGGILQANSSAAFGPTGSAINQTGGLIGITSDNALSNYVVTRTGGGTEFVNYASNLPSTTFGTLFGAATGVASSLNPGALVGSTNLTYFGPGTLILNGTNPNYSGTTNLSGGTLNVASGGLGTGNVILNGGTFQYATGNTDDLTTGRTLTVGVVGGGIDTNGNNVTFAGNVLQPVAGTLSGPFTKFGAGTLTLNGSLNPTSLLVRGGTLALGSTGSISTVISSTSTANDFASIGLMPGDNGTLTLTGGSTATIAGDFNVADQNNSTGTLNVGGTSVLSVRTLYVGKSNAASGTVVQTGGTVQQANNGTTGGPWIIGGNGVAANTATGTYTLTGGTFNASTAQVRVGGGGIGTMTISGTGTALSTGGFVVASTAGSVGTLTLGPGGTLTTANLNGGSGTSTANFNGGTLAPTAANTAFLTGLTTANVQAGGLVLNTAGFNVSAGQNLLHDTTAGAPATDGGVTKLGAGVLTLSGASTYTGGTLVSAGTILTTTNNALGTGPVTLAGGNLSLSVPVTTAVTGFGQFNNGINVNGSTSSFNPSITPTTFTVTKLGLGSFAASSYIPFTVNDAGTFNLSFTYNHSTGTGLNQVADGISFGFQNDPRGLLALGGGGGAEGYAAGNGGAVTNSEVGFVDLYNGAYGFGANGVLVNTATGATIYAATGQTVTLNYNGPTKTLTETIGTFTATTTVDLATVLGGTAGGTGSGYFGFSGATGGVSADQSFVNPTYTVVIPGAASISNAVVVTPGTTSTLSLAVTIGGNNGSIGALTLGSGSTLNLVPVGTAGGSGYSLKTGSVNLVGASTLNVSNTTANGPGVALLGALNDGGIGAALTVGGPGTVALTAPATSFVAASAVIVTPTGLLSINSPTALGSGTVADNGTVALGAGSGVTTVNFLGGGANNVVLNGNALNLAPTSPLTVYGTITEGAPAGGSVNVSSGSVTLLGAETYTGLTTVGAGASVTLAGTLPAADSILANGTFIFGPNTTAGLLTRAKATITVGPAGTVALAGTGSSATRTVLLLTAGLNVAAGGSVDVGNSDLVVRNGSLSAVTALAATGFGSGTFNGPGGLYSTSAAADATRLTTVGVIQNSMDQTTTGTPVFASFDGVAVTAADVLVKYTLFGDANLDGKVDGSDYAQIDAGFNADQATPGSATGWFNGDFNYDSTVDASDYTLIDNAFNLQSGQIAPSILTSPTALIAVATDEVAPVVGTSAVPEPASAGLLAAAAAGLLARRTRRQAR